MNAPDSSPPIGRCLHTYRLQCAHRWTGPALEDACANWELFEAHYADVAAIVKPYLKDNRVHDIVGRSLNPGGSLTSWLWQCAAAQENSWIWDFCSHYQRTHLARGIIPYCKMVIAEINATQDANPGHPEIALDFETPAYVPPRYVHGLCGNNPCTCAVKMSLPSAGSDAPGASESKMKK